MACIPWVTFPIFLGDWHTVLTLHLCPSDADRTGRTLSSDALEFRDFTVIKARGEVNLEFFVVVGSQKKFEI